MLTAWEDYTWEKERTKIILDGKRMLSSCCINLELPLQVHSVLWGSCRVWMLSHFQFILGSYSHLPDPCYQSLVGMLFYLSNAFSLVAWKSFLISCHHPFMQLLCRSPTSGQPSFFCDPSLGCTLRWPILGPCFSLMLRSHDTVCYFSIPGFGELAEIIKNLDSSSTFSSSLDHAKLDTSSRYYGLFLLLWCMDYWIFGAPTTLSGSGRTLDERQTPRHPLAMLNAIRLVSFLQQGAFKQGLIIICLDKILICLMNLILQEPWVARALPQDQP